MSFRYVIKIFLKIVVWESPFCFERIQFLFKSNVIYTKKSNIEKHIGNPEKMTNSFIFELVFKNHALTPRVPQQNKAQGAARPVMRRFKLTKVALL